MTRELDSVSLSFHGGHHRIDQRCFECILRIYSRSTCFSDVSAAVGFGA